MTCHVCLVKRLLCLCTSDMKHNCKCKCKCKNAFQLVYSTADFRAARPGKACALEHFKLATKRQNRHVGCRTGKWGAAKQQHGGVTQQGRRRLTALAWPQEGQSQEVLCMAVRERQGGWRQMGCISLSQCPQARLAPAQRHVSFTCVHPHACALCSPCNNSFCITCIPSSSPWYCFACFHVVLLSFRMNGSC